MINYCFSNSNNFLQKCYVIDTFYWDFIVFRLLLVTRNSVAVINHVLLFPEVYVGAHM